MLTLTMRPLVRLSLRRYIHSLTPIAPSRRVHDRTKFAIGASLAVVGYVTWRMAGNDQRIALDTSLPPVSRETETFTDTRSKTDAPAPSTPPGSQSQVKHDHVDHPPAVAEAVSTPDGAVDKEEESEGAFNPSTGEINWDCPCLGGMAHGPCGEQFREAFSCFVFSEQEPKGIDCVEKFKNMQDCFREHPDIYGEEIADDEEDTPDLASVEDKHQQPKSSPTSLTMPPPSPESLHTNPLSDMGEMDGKTKLRQRE